MFRDKVFCCAGYLANSKRLSRDFWQRRVSRMSRSYIGVSRFAGMKDKPCSTTTMAPYCCRALPCSCAWNDISRQGRKAPRLGE